jgi:hypothetical protein
MVLVNNFPFLHFLCEEMKHVEGTIYTKGNSFQITYFLIQYHIIHSSGALLMEIIVS